ncbi:MAG: hypothetical protein DMG90_09390 [Acidobacteria bacterium]|nr:MAG: hypothetical protein DMG90_09390 [Acidobacteriota bacterium]
MQTSACSRTLLAIPDHSTFFSRMMLTYGKDIAIRIFKPCHLVTSGRCPNSKFAIFDKGVFFQGNAAILQPSDDRFYILDFPSQDRALRWREFGTFVIRMRCPPTLTTSAYGSGLTNSNSSLPSYFERRDDPVTKQGVWVVPPLRAFLIPRTRRTRWLCQGRFR